MTTTATTTATSATATATAAGASILTALGAGSGIDTNALVSKLVAAQREPQDDALATRSTNNTAKISALASATSGIDNFASALDTLISGGSLFTQATSGDASIAAVTALAGSQLGNLNSTIEVKRLAQAQTLTAAAVTSASAVIGTGSFTLTNAGQTRTITIDSTNNSLTGLAAAINASNVGVSASILTDTTGSRLVLKGATGANYNFTMSLNAGADAGLAQFAYPASGGVGLTQAQAAQDALLNVDGVDVTRPTNSISDVLAGVRIDLKQAAVGTKVAIGSSFPSADISAAVTNFVSAYNELKGQLDTATASASSDGTTAAGALHGDAGVRAMQQQLAKLTSTALVGTGSPKTLAEIGVSTQRDGTLKVDAATLANALATNPEGVEALFNPTQSSDSPLVSITSAMGKAKAGTYTLSNITVGPPPSGTINGVAAIASGSSLIAAANSGAVGLVIKPLGDVASATIIVEPGLAGALQAIRDSLRATQGPLAATQSKLDAETKAISDDTDKLNTRITAYQNQLTTQFNAMNTALTALNSTKSYLEQQIKLWTSSDN